MESAAKLVHFASRWGALGKDVPAATKKHYNPITSMQQDGFELVSRIEDEFSVTVSDAEMATAHTVGGLADVLCAKLDSPAAAMSNRAFFRATQAIAESAGVPRHTIVPDTLLEPLIPLAGRVDQWKQIEQRSGLEFPPLVHSKRWKDRFMLVSMAGAALPVLALWWSLYELGWLPGVFVWLFSGPAFIAWFVLISRVHRRLLLATPQLAVDLPYETAGELGTAVLALNLDALAEANGRESLTSEIVWHRLAKVVGERMGITPQLVDENTDLRQTLRAR